MEGGEYDDDDAEAEAQIQARAASFVGRIPRTPPPRLSSLGPRRSACSFFFVMNVPERNGAKGRRARHSR